MRIKDIAACQVIGVALDDSLRSAAKHLSDDEIGALVVFDSTGAVGILSERDLTRAAADEVDFDTTGVEEYMTEAPVGLDEGASVQKAVSTMLEHGIRHVAVSRDRAIIGMISARDVLGAVAGTDLLVALR